MQEKKSKNQSYYAAMFGSTLKPIEAQLKGNTLQTFEIHAYLPPYSEITSHESYQTVKKINPSHLQATFSTRFQINEDGFIYSPNYCSGSFSSECNTYWQPYSQRGYAKTYNFIDTWPGKFAPDLLYAIPQTVWDDFLALLPGKAIVEGLNLSVHRHLWPAYNYAAKTNDTTLQTWRTNAFSSYHFLVALVDPVNEANCFYGAYQPWKELIDQGMLAKWKKNEDAKKTLGSYATPTYIDRFAHCPSLYDFISLGRDFIGPKAQSIYGENLVNTTQLNAFIALLPSSKQDPVAFQNMLSDVNVIKDLGTTDLSQRINGRILYHARNQFGLFKDKNLSTYSQCNTYFTALFDDLIYPELVRTFFKKSELDYATYDMQSTNDMLSLYYSARTAFKIILHEYLTIDKLIQLSTTWSNKRTALNSKKPDALIKLQWHPLFTTQRINQVTFTCIETEAELKKEGHEMYHCVGGFGYMCLSGETHIIRAETPSGERATIRLEISTITKQFSIIENLKRGKKTPCQEILDASQLLEDKINNGSILLNVQRGKINSSAQALDDITKYYPYPLYDENSQEAVYQSYTKEVLPSFMQADNYQSMIKKLSLKLDWIECIKDALPNCQLTEDMKMDV